MKVGLGWVRVRRRQNLKNLQTLMDKKNMKLMKRCDSGEQTAEVYKAQQGRIGCRIRSDYGSVGLLPGSHVWF